MIDKKNIKFSKTLFGDIDVNDLAVDKHKEFNGKTSKRKS